MPQLVIGNTTAEYSGVPARDLAPKAIHKQHAVSTRTAWLLNDGDVFLSSRPLTDAFRTYLTATLGLDPDTITFLTPQHPATKAGFLDSEQLLDPALSELLRHRITQPEQWTVVPYIHDRAVAQLGDHLGLAGTANPPFFAQGGSDAFNSKFYFRIWATGLGVPIAPGRSSSTPTMTVSAVHDLLTRTGSVIVKQDNAASGRGNLLVTTDAETPGIGVATTCHVPAGADEDTLRGLLTPHLGTDRAETVIEAYYPHSRVLYSEVAVGEPPAAPVILNWGDMRMEPTWNGFAVPAADLPGQARDLMLHWSTAMGRYLQTTGYRGYLNCDSILTPDGQLLFNEVNARIGGCTHMHFAAQRVLGPDYLNRYTLLTRNDLHVTSFEKLAWAISRDPDLDGTNGSGVLLLVDDVPYTGTVQYLAYGPTPQAAARAENRLHETASTC
ncbi:hypothetical protein [Streptomyces arenae]|uniref:preATP grasp domain-containing protein n=1 Tax=Streptomyces arenae TaxID=29301 RepID=UPI002658B399|nr:hypothetical protein [Streptomyces arenae]MCG7205399.1 hypothetical protein [Streptomyces arenae]